MMRSASLPIARALSALTATTTTTSYRFCSTSASEEAGEGASSASGGVSHCAGLYRYKLEMGEVSPYPAKKLSDDEVDNMDEVLKNLIPPPSSNGANWTTEQLKEKLTKDEEQASSSASTTPISIQNSFVADSGLTGAFIPGDIGGLEVSNSGLASLVESVSKIHAGKPSSQQQQKGGVAQGMQLVQQYVNQAGVSTHLLKTVATKEQQGRWFSQILDGQMVVAWAPEEEACGADVSAVSTRATFNGSNSTYEVTGVKCPVFGVSNATHFIILAKTETQGVGADGQPKITHRLSMMMVDKTAAGVEIIQNPDATTSDVGVIKMNKVVVPTDNVIGTVGQAFSSYMISKHHTNFTHASSILGMVKKSLDISAEVLGASRSNSSSSASSPSDDDKGSTPITTQSGSPATSTQAGRKWLDLAAQAYALESALYLVTGNLDKNTEDSLIESALMCTMASDLSLKTASYLEQNLLGYGASASSSSLGAEEQLSRLATSLRLHGLVANESDNLKQTASSCAVEDFGVWFNNCSSLQMMQARTLRTLGQTDKLGFKTAALAKEVAKVEKAAQDFSGAVENFYVKNGLRVVDESAKMERLAEAAMNLFMCTATLSRVERCIKRKLPTKARETDLAIAFITDSIRTVDRLNDSILKAAQSTENSYGRITADLLEKYLPEEQREEELQVGEEAQQPVEENNQ